MDGFATLEGECKIQGDLYHVGAFPGLAPGTGIVHGQLWRVWAGLERRALAILDLIEGFDEDNWSLFVRRSVRLAEPEVEAFVYFWNHHTDGLDLIASGDWKEFSEKMVFSR
jgi:gamma-glutamylcyclotransferase (GGCT)/AIG2-like uncharacterized protein YtfP